MDLSFLDGLDASITVCDTEGVITFMNARAGRAFEEQGGLALVGKNLYDCHPGESRDKLKAVMESRKLNTYTIEKNGKKKLIWQSPWEMDGKFAGLVEIVLPIPFDTPHHIRK